MTDTTGDTDDERDDVALPVAEPWFVRRRLADGITLVTEPHVHRYLRCNVWHVEGRDRDLVVDTALGLMPLRAEVARAATPLLADGDVVDLGDRAFEVLHLPGHSPGSIGLWEAATGVLFSGDALYDGPLLDQLDGSDTDDYVRTIERLRALPVTVVHGGHEDSFGRARLVQLCDAYLAGEPYRL